MKRPWHEKRFSISNLILIYDLNPIQIPEQMAVNWKFGNFGLTKAFYEKYPLEDGDEPPQATFEMQSKQKPQLNHNTWKDVVTF
jgi:hypothetical protein